MRRKESSYTPYRLVAWGMGLVGLLSLPARVEAIPAFARQMHMQCMQCHYQQFPELNAFGRAFKDSGYTLLGEPEAESAIKGDKDNLTLPFVLNASVFFNGNYQKTNGRSPEVRPYADAQNAMLNREFGTALPNAYQVGPYGGSASGPYVQTDAASGTQYYNAVNPALNAVALSTIDPAASGSNSYYPQNRVRQYDANKGQYQFPQGDASLFIGGHAGDHVGFFFQMNATGAPSFDGFKMPLHWDIAGQSVQIVPFATGADGPEYGYDPMATGFFGATAFSLSGNTAGEYMTGNSFGGYADQAATGGAFVLKNDYFWIDVTKWSPGSNTFAQGQPTDKPSASYGQIGVSPHVGDFDILVSLRGWGGHTRIADPDGQAVGYPNEMMDVETNAYGADAQAQGPIAGIPVGFYVSMLTAPPTQKQWLVEPNTILDGTVTNSYAPTDSQKLPVGYDFNPQTPVLVNSVSPTASNTTIYRVRGTPNLYNAGYNTKHAASIGFKVAVIPETLVLFANYRIAVDGSYRGEQSNHDFAAVIDPYTGDTYGMTKYKGANESDVATLGASYALAENVRFELNYSKYMGNQYEKGSVLNRRTDANGGDLRLYPEYGAQSPLNSNVPAGTQAINFTMVAGL